MSELTGKGVWVEIRLVLLPPGERAPQVPAETRAVPLEMKVKGFLVAPAARGKDAEIETLAGRRLKGTLIEIDPAYVHGFGPSVPELSAIAAEVSATREG